MYACAYTQEKLSIAVLKLTVCVANIALHCVKSLRIALRMKATGDLFTQCVKRVLQWFFYGFYVHKHI